MDQRVLLAGPTGLVGRHVLQLLLDDAGVGEVVALTRRPLALPHPKLSEALVDFDHLEAFASPPVDDFFCCLGTTIGQAGSQQAFRDVDLGYPLAIARMALAAGATRSFFLSAMGANPASRVFYNRVKGELESEMARLAFRTVVALRPSLLVGGRVEFRAGERAALVTLRALSPLIPPRYRPIDAAVVARAMLACARSPTEGRHVIESDAIARLGKK
jgi:uncharacterized protein YbjT (DUF2867 family)